jgi:hypothetical protein
MLKYAQEIEKGTREQMISQRGIITVTVLVLLCPIIVYAAARLLVFGSLDRTLNNLDPRDLRKCESMAEEGKEA